VQASGNKRARSPSPPARTPSLEEPSRVSTSDESSAKKAKTVEAIHARAKSTLTFGHEAFASKEMQAGKGRKFHEFSNVSFSPDKAEEYRVATGLAPIETKQQWGLPEKVTTTMYRSRRGSLSGFAEMEDGTVKGWRLHSLPTSESLRDQTVKDAEGFQEIFDKRAQKLMQAAVNTVGTEQTVNAVLSDIGKVRFNGTDFEFSDATHAMGVSGKGVDSKASSSPERLFASSIKVAKADGKAATAAQTYHSEPMALALHNGARDTPIREDSEMVGAVASFPNQVCYQCGRTFQEEMGTHSVISGTPGKPFGGQKEGDMHSPSTGTTVSRAAPMSTLKGDSHKKEIASIYAHHKRW
jgi:hypothetical protein